MASTTAISVVIPARNAAATIARALQSVLAQTRRPDEIIVVDDASKDDTAAVAGSFPLLRLIRLPASHGAAAARNAGIAAARGAWIAFLDADDRWLPQKLERQHILVNAGVSLVFCASREYEDGNLLGDTFRNRPVRVGRDAWKYLLHRNFIATPTVMAPRALLGGLGGFNEHLPVGEDQDMWIRLALTGKLAYVAETLVDVHVQPSSLSRYRAGDQSRYVLPMIRRHLTALRQRLSVRERCEILAERYANAGHIARANGDRWRAALFFAHAAFYGRRPLSWRTAAVLDRAG